MRKKVIVLLQISCLIILLTACKDASSENLDIQEPAQVTQGEIQEESIPEDFVYNPYALPDIVLNGLGDHYEWYKKLIDAFHNGDTTFTVENKEQWDSIHLIAFRFYPLFMNFESYKFDTATNTATFNYGVSPEEQRLRDQEFRERVEKIINENVYDPADEFTVALSLYRYVSENIDYILELGISTYRSIMEGVGLCTNYTDVYQFLLNQLGIEGINATGMVSQNESHEWLIVKLDGEYYHMDPTFENSSTGGLGLDYFGMTDDERYQTGIIKPYQAPAVTYLDDGSKIECTSDEFIDLRGYDSWKLDKSTRKIKLFKNGEEVSQFSKD